MSTPENTAPEPYQAPVPVPTTPAAVPGTAAAVEYEVDNRTKDVKRNAWLLWFFLGGTNAHLFYVYPKQRLWIALGTVFVFWPIAGMLAFFTLGISLVLWWALCWIPLVLDSTWRGYRENVREQVEAEALRRKHLYGA